MRNHPPMRSRIATCVCSGAGLAIVLLVAMLAPGQAVAATDHGVCLRDAANIDQGSICSANDVRVAMFNIIGTPPASCEAGESLSLVLQAVSTCGSQDRYDVGFYIAQDGGDAKTRGSVCFRDYLNPPSNNNLDLDVSCA